MGYIGKIYANGVTALVGSTMYGVCHTSANVALKLVIDTNNVYGNFINANFDGLILPGITVHIKFIYGNTITDSALLLIGSSISSPIIGKFVCDAGTIISFTYDENSNWVVNDNINTEYVFKSTYNATTNKALTENDIGAAASKDVITNIISNTSSQDLPTADAVVRYVVALTGGLSGLVGAMHFRGFATVLITDGGTQNPVINDYLFNGNTDNAGDVVLWNQEEYVWTGSRWELLGAQSSYALNSNTDIVSKIDNFTPNTLPSLTITNTEVSKVIINEGSTANLTTTTYTINNVTQAGRATTASVTNGVLNITLGLNTVLSSLPIIFKGVDEFTPNSPTSVTALSITIGSASNWNHGSLAILSAIDKTVIAPINLL